MAVVKRKGKAKTTYRVMVYSNGRCVHSKTFDKASDARAYDAECRVKLQRGERLGSSDSVMLYDAMDRYLREVTPRKKRNGGRDESKAKRVKSYLSNMKIVDVTVSDVQSLINTLTDNYAPSYVCTITSFLSAVFEESKRWGYCDVNPVRECKKPSLRGSERDRRFVSDEEERIFKELAKNRNLRDYVVLAVETSIRRRELWSLLWSDINFDGGYIKLRAEETKNGESRVVPMSENVDRVLRDRYTVSKHKRVFSCWSAPDAITKAWERVCERAGVVDFHVHDIRHEAVSRLSNVFSLLELSMIVGHRDIRMTRRYYHPRPEELVAKLRKKKGS